MAVWQLAGRMCRSFGAEGWSSFGVKEIVIVSFSSEMEHRVHICVGYKGHASSNLMRI